VDNKVILFHGFNNSIKGNTKYLLNNLTLNEFDVYVALSKYEWESNAESESEAGYEKIKKGSSEYHEISRKAKFHILESWTDLSIPKIPGSIWIQMWHGTPIKKMLFDSSERFIVNKNPRHKSMKLRDLSRWDFVLSQNKFCTDALSSSFSLNKDQILEIGYPRTDLFYHRDADTISALRSSIVKKYNLDEKKLILLYTPTWRDYNQYSTIKCFDYFLEIKNESDLDKFNVVVLGHPFSNDNFQNDGMVYLEGEDVQELILVSDLLVTDYSSIVFDWILLKKPFALLWKDEQLFDYSRGVYSNIKNDFRDYIFSDEISMFNFLQNFPGLDKIKNIGNYIEQHPGSSKKICDLINQDF
jgi:CDP-glycerol glycerophosphotransferase (TagB/SpsB family)